MITLGQFLSALIMGLIIGGVIIWLAYKYFTKIDYHIPCEYKFFVLHYTGYGEDIKQLNELSKQGWEIASCAGEDNYRAFFILQRAIEDDED